jgi:hypothetical protein
VGTNALEVLGAVVTSCDLELGYHISCELTQMLCVDVSHQCVVGHMKTTLEQGTKE